MNSLIILYILFWISLCITAFILLIKNRKQIILFKKDYLLFLLKPWKIILFLIATILLAYISTLWFDPSWDVIETIIICILTFYFAPYTAWIFYRFYKWINKSKKELFIAIILMFFSSCWFYDFYAWIFLLWHYSKMFFYNLWLSPFFYLAWWIMWNLDFSKEKWVIFTYTQKEWIDFKWDKKWLNKILIYTLPAILFMVFVFGYFIYVNI